MSVVVYRNDGSGGPVDETVPVATLADGTTTWTDPDPRPAPSDTSYRVARRTAGGLESLARSKTVRVLVDSAGADATGLPVAPRWPGARSAGLGQVRVEWTDTGVGPAPSEFRVRGNVGPFLDFGLAPLATVPATPRRPGAGRLYWVVLAGLTAGEEYVFNVRGANLAGEEANEATVRAVPPGAGPAAVDGLTAVATGRSR